MGISSPQLLIMLLIVALLFGTKKLRNIGGDLGSALKGFKNAMTDDKDDKDDKDDGVDATTEVNDTSDVIEGEVQKSEQAAEQKEEKV